MLHTCWNKKMLTSDWVRMISMKCLLNSIFSKVFLSGFFKCKLNYSVQESVNNITLLAFLLLNFLLLLLTLNSLPYLCVVIYSNKNYFSRNSKFNVCQFFYKSQCWHLSSITASNFSIHRALIKLVFHI